MREEWGQQTRFTTFASSTRQSGDDVLERKTTINNFKVDFYVTLWYYYSKWQQLSVRWPTGPCGRVTVWVVARRLRARWGGWGIPRPACRSYMLGGCAVGEGGYAHWLRRWTPVCQKRRCLCLAYYTIRLLQLTGGWVAVYFPTLLRWYNSTTGPTGFTSSLRLRQASVESPSTDHSPLSRCIALSFIVDPHRLSAFVSSSAKIIKKIAQRPARYNGHR